MFRRKDDRRLRRLPLRSTKTGVERRARDPHDLNAVGVLGKRNPHGFEHRQRIKRGPRRPASWAVPRSHTQPDRGQVFGHGFPRRRWIWLVPFANARCTVRRRVLAMRDRSLSQRRWLRFCENGTRGMSQLPLK
jgi:hypothetical protein